ncbi:MAG: phosphate ABC transporter substrate-binding protein PstS [Gammaproteobacteria bacterium]
MKPISRFASAVLLVIGLTGTAVADSTKQVAGAGSTFVYPVLAKWAEAYNKETGVQLNYQSIGSGGGVKQILAKTVDFGASDAPLTVKELDAGDLIQFPTVMGGVVPVVNLPGVAAGSVQLNPDVLADIFLGTIKKWNDPRIAATNKGVALPDTLITIVHRADGSGTTWVFTNYLTKVSKSWAEKVGNDKSVSWPVGVGGKGNEGVASYVERVKGSIGYVEYAYALQNKMNYTKLRNHDGNFVAPSAETFQAAAAKADWTHAPGMYLVLTDGAGPDSWPITGATFILVHKRQDKPDTAREVLKFFDWTYRKGEAMATALVYVPMPANVVELVEKSWAQNIKGPDGQPIWSGTTGH